MVYAQIDLCFFNAFQMEVRMSEDKDLPHQNKLRICQDLMLFLRPVREKLLQFEQEIKDR